MIHHEGSYASLPLHTGARADDEGLTNSCTTEDDEWPTPNPQTAREAQGLLKTCDWWEIEDDLAILLHNNPDFLQLFRSVHDAGVNRPIVLMSLARLRTNQDLSPREYCPCLFALVDFLVDSVEWTVKRACIRALLMVRSKARCKLDDLAVADVLAFITQRETKDLLKHYSEQVLLWELRAMYLCRIDRELRHQKHRERIKEGAEQTAVYISRTAKFVENGLGKSTKMVTNRLDSASEALKSRLKPQSEPLLGTRSSVVAVTLTDAAKRATDKMNETSKHVVKTVRETSVQGIHVAADKFQHAKLGPKLVPHPDSRTLLSAAGQVGMAGLGAAVVVAEALAESTKSVYLKTAEVTADVVEHKYGSGAGQVVRNTGNTAGNIARTAANVAFFFKITAAKSLKVVANDTSKKHLQRSAGPTEPEPYDISVSRTQSAPDLRVEKPQICVARRNSF
jgi:hypothetical protein